MSASTMRLHLALSTDFPAPDIVDAARAADDGGVDTVWVTDIRFLRDCYTLLGAMAVTTRHVVLASGVSDPYTRHPAYLAGAAATLAELAPGRSVLGLGAGGSGLDRIGVSRREPLRTVEAAIVAMRAMFTGERADADTPGFRLANGKLAFAFPGSVPIALVAHGPAMYRLAGRLADIVFIGNYARPDGIAWARERLAEGTAKRAHGLQRLREVWRVDTCVADRRDDARGVMRGRVRQLLASGYYGETFLGPIGLSNLVGHADALDVEIDEVVDAVALAGTRDEVAERIRDTRRHSAMTEICYRPYAAPGQTLAEATNAIEAAIAAA